MLNRAIRATASARLEAAGLTLDAVGNQYYATVLAVTGRERSSLSAAEHEALSKAVVALCWRAPELALLCVPDIQAPAGDDSDKQDFEGRADSTADGDSPLCVGRADPGAPPVRPPQQLEPATLAAYVQALNAEAVILLERTLLPEALQLPWTQVAVCDDFFGSLDDQNKKRSAWIELQMARKTSALTD